MIHPHVIHIVKMIYSKGNPLNSYFLNHDHLLDEEIINIFKVSKSKIFISLVFIENNRTAILLSFKSFYINTPFLQIQR